MVAYKKINVGFGLPGLSLQSEDGQPLVFIAEHAKIDEGRTTLSPGMPFYDGEYKFFYFGVSKPASDVFLYCLGGKWSKVIFTLLLSLLISCRLWGKKT